MAATNCHPTRSRRSTPDGRPAGLRTRSRTGWPVSAHPGVWLRAGRWICSGAGGRAITETSRSRFRRQAFPRSATAFPDMSSTRRAAAGSGRTPRRSNWPPCTRHGSAIQPPVTTCWTCSGNRTTATPGSRRRDETIRLPYSEIVHHTRDGIPYLAPELVLLFKAKHARPKDRRDFDATVPHLTGAQRATLAELLARVHPGHVWLTDL